MQYSIFLLRIMENIMKKVILTSVLLLSLVLPVYAKDENPMYSGELYENVKKLEFSNITPEYISDIENLMWDLNNSKNPDKAIETASYIIDLNKKLYGENSSPAAKAFLTRSLLETWYFMPKNAKNDLDKAYNIYLKNTKNIDLKRNILENYTSYHQGVEENLKASSYAKQLLELNKKNISAKDIYLAKSNIYSMQSDFNNAIKFYKAYLNEIKKSKNKNNEDIFNCYLEIARKYMNQGSYKDAEEYIKKADNMLTKMNDENNFFRLQLKYLENEYYSDQNDIEKVEEILKESKELLEASNDKNQADVVDTEYMYYYKDKKDYDKYKEVEKKLKSRQGNFPKESLMPILSNEITSEIYQNLHQYKKAQELVNNTLNQLEEIKDYAPAYYGKFLRQGLYISTARKNPVIAKQYLDKIYSAYKQADSENSIAFIDINRRYGDYYYNIENFDVAIKYYKKALEVAKKYKSNKDLADLYSKLGQLYARLHQGGNALSNINKSIEYASIGNDKLSATVYRRILEKYYVYNSLKMYYEASVIFDEIEKNLDNITGNQNLIKSFYYLAKGWEAYGFKDYNTAVENGKKALEFAKNSWEKENIYYMLYKTYDKQGRTIQAKKYKRLANF